MSPENTAEQPEAWDAVGGAFAQGLLRELFTSDLGKWLLANGADVLGGLVGLLFTLVGPVGVSFARAIAKSEDLVAPEMAEIAAAAASDVFGIDVPTSAFTQKRNREGRKQASGALGAGVINTIKGAGGSLQPGDEAAQRYLTMVLNMSLEGWYQGWFFELMSSMIPLVEVGNIEKFAGLDDKLAESLGFGRLSRRVLSPLIDTTVVTPFRWQINKAYRPELLSTSDAVRQFVRGRWSREQLEEELARQGWSAERIEAQLNAQRKFFGPGDVRTFDYRKHWTHDQGIQHLRDQGYTLEEAEDALRLEGIKRIEQNDNAIASALIGAYASRDIGKAELESTLRTFIQVDTERALITELADVRRTFNIKRLTPGQAEAAVKAGILAVRDYREVLRREGYPEDDVLTLELLLRYEINREIAIDKHRAEAEAERAAEKLKREEERARRKAEIEAERALHARGSLTDLEQAVVRGLIPIARYVEVASAQYDADTVDILVGLVEDDRLKFVEAAARAEEARQRAARRNLDVGALEQAVLNDAISLEDFARHPSLATLDATDRGILVATLTARKRALEEAQTQRRDAAIKASIRAIDLGRFETLVRRGHRTTAQYDALLRSLGFDDASRAAMRELLELQIADDQAAARARKDADAKLRAKGLSLEQLRRAVLLNLKSLDDYQRFLASEGFTTDAQSVLTGELRADVQEAEAARARRQVADTREGARALPLATVRRAARLGVVSPDVYRARLRADGYSDDDIDIEIDLLLLEIADVQAARGRRDALNSQADARGLSLSQVEHAVKVGTATIGDYRAAAAGAGYGVDEIAELVAVLEQELEVQADAQTRHDQIEGELATRHLSLAQLEAAVKANLKTLDDYFAYVVDLGYSDDDAELLVALLEPKLGAAATAA